MVDVSVIMSVRNTPIEYLNASLTSTLIAIINAKRDINLQIEFLICDDNSTEESTRQALLNFAGQNQQLIQLFYNDTHLGVGKSLNMLIEKASGEYICQMDSDDIMLPDRITEQYSYMITHPELTMVSGLSKNNFMNVLPIWMIDMYRNHTVIDSLESFKKMCILHPTIFYKREDIIKHQIKYNDYIVCHDYYFLSKVLDNNLKICLQPLYVIYYRGYPGSLTKANKDIYLQEEKEMQNKILNKIEKGETF